jgi:fucose permease
MFHLLLAIIYLSFISLGLPDALLGAAWPTMYQEFQVPVSYAGAISMIISCGTIFSSLQSDRLTKRFGPGKITAASVALTSIALFGFSISHSYWMLCLWAIPYGLGAGSVDASLNNYVALHYESHHMSWLHCMWGLGASIGPYIMSYALTGGMGWNAGYGYISIMQAVLTAIILFSLPIWKNCPDTIENTGNTDSQTASAPAKALTIPQILAIPGAKAVLIMFFCYCALESTAGLWASSFLVLYHHLDAETAASFASLFYIGITVGRGINGFIAMKLKDTQMIRMGQAIIAAGIVLMLLPLGEITALIGLVTIGLGCAPVYPCVIHSTPEHFGPEKSQALIGVQMACAYVGSLSMPPIFGLIANHISVALYPAYLLLILALMFAMHELLIKQTSHS